MNRVASGTAFSVAAAILFGLSLPASRALLDLGANALTIAVLRYLALALALSAWVSVRRRHHPALGARQALGALAVGVSFAVVTLGQLLAIGRITVSLTTVLFYTYPAMTMVAVAVLERRAPSRRAIAALLTSVAGLVLALDVELGALDTLGVLLALLAALAASASFLLIERTLAHADALRSTTVSAWGASAVVGVALASVGDVALPASLPGRALLAGVVLAFAGAVVSTFIGVARAGSVRASLLLFLEPVVAIGVAVAALGERLTLAQQAGAVLVIAAVIVSARAGRG